MKKPIIFFTLAVFLLSVSASAGSELTGARIIEKSQIAFHYQGEDMKAKITMKLIDKGGGVRKRVLTMLRLEESDGGNQKIFIYFHEPGDLRNMTFMVWKYPDREDDRWIYISSVDLIRRIAADDKRSSFVGSDFTYEDISGRAASFDTHKILRSETIDGKDYYVIESVPKEKVDYIRKISWIDKENFLPLKEDYFDVQDELFRVFTADKIEDIADFPTITVRTMTNVKTGHRTEVSYENVSYDLGLDDGDFSERSMRKPPRDWIK